MCTQRPEAYILFSQKKFYPIFKNGNMHNRSSIIIVFISLHKLSEEASNFLFLLKVPNLLGFLSWELDSRLEGWMWQYNDKIIFWWLFSLEYCLDVSDISWAIHSHVREQLMQWNATHRPVGLEKINSSGWQVMVIYEKKAFMKRQKARNSSFLLFIFKDLVTTVVFSTCLAYLHPCL